MERFKLPPDKLMIAGDPLHHVQIIRTMIITLLFLTISFQSAIAQETTDAQDSYANVEERRLRVRIIEEHDKIIKDRETLLLKEKELEKLREEIDSKLDELDRKLEELARQKAILRKIPAENIETADDQSINLSRIYENMDPVNAAVALADLNPESAARILAGMRSRSAARILDILNSRTAAEITEILTSFQQ